MKKKEKIILRTMSKDEMTVFKLILGPHYSLEGYIGVVDQYDNHKLVKNTEYDWYRLREEVGDIENELEP